MDAGAGAAGRPLAEANATGLLASLLTENSDLQTQFVWLVRRTVLPILLFILWFRNQSKGTDTKHRYPRDTILTARKAVDGDEVPESLSNLKLLDEASVQKALGGPPPRPRGSADAGSRSGAGARPKRAPADKARSADARGRGPAARAAEADTPAGGAGASGGAGDGASPTVVTGRRSLTEQERVHFESLLNFAAFSHKDRPQRIFLPCDGQPPPPPKRPAPNAKADPQEEAKVNSDAQMVLKGAANQKIQMKCPDIAKNLHQQLVDSHVRTLEATFSLMVEVCVNGGDLKGASDFLMKMEAAGYSADSELLDKVMDLYSESWSGGGPSGAQPALSSTAGHSGARGGDDEEDVAPRASGTPSAPPAASSSGSLTKRPLTTGASLRPGGGRQPGGPPASAARPAAKRDPDGRYAGWSDDEDDPRDD